MTTRLLLVEDNACVRLAFSRLLGGAGIQVHAVESAEDAATYLEDHDADVALFDCRLPGRPGTDLAAECARRWPTMRVILMSAEDGFQAVARHTCPDVPFLRKPIAPEWLVSTVIRQAAKPLAGPMYALQTASTKASPGATGKWTPSA